MTDVDQPCVNGTPCRFTVQLFIVHPSIGPPEIEQALGLSASHSHRVGDGRVTPKGTSLVGTYRDTRWRYSSRHVTSDQRFAKELDKLIELLSPHRVFLQRLRETGGRATLVVQFLGDGYFGDEIAASTLAKIADLGLGLGVEVFADAQC